MYVIFLYRVFGLSELYSQLISSLYMSVYEHKGSLLNSESAVTSESPSFSSHSSRSPLLLTSHPNTSKSTNNKNNNNDRPPPLTPLYAPQLRTNPSETLLKSLCLIIALLLCLYYYIMIIIGIIVVIIASSCFLLLYSYV